MRVLVTGANGFLGSHLVDELLESGEAQVRALVRKSSDLRWLKGKQVEYVHGDVTQSPQELAAAVEGVEVVYHLAGVTKALRRRTFYSVNQRGTRKLILACLKRQTPPSRLVLVSSAGAVGPSLTPDPLDESVEPHPVTVYGRSKLAGERVARQFMDRMSIAIVRPGAIYGPRDYELLPAFRAVRRGLAPRPAFFPGRFNLGHARDLARAVRLAGTVEAAGSETFFIGGDNTTQVELSKTIAAVLGKRRLLSVRIPGLLLRIASVASSAVERISQRPRIFTFGNVGRFVARNWALDLSKARRELGYLPAYSLGVGVEDTVAWYRSHGLI